MIVDKNLVMSDAQALTLTTVEYSTVIDTEVAGSNIGGGTPIWLICRVNTTFAGTSGTFIVALQNATASTGTYVDILISPTYTTAQLVKGFDMLTVPLPVDNLRYLRMRYTPATGSVYPTSAIDALLTLNAPRN